MITLVDRREAGSALPQDMLSGSWFRSLMRLVPRCVSDVPSIPFAVIYVDPVEIRKLNKQYRDINRVTDVLSFAYTDSEGAFSEGEIVMCPAQALAQRKRFGTTIHQEFARLFFHGVLHIYGYDHISSSDRRVMRGLEECLMKKFT
ncbi:MAG: rRNA maturation RNase YbeY [Patescibacteria group bacterium]|mgnify:CR=1 FL=1